MRSLLLFALLGCGDTRDLPDGSHALPDGFLDGEHDLAVGDLGAADFAGGDLARAGDLAAAMTDLAVAPPSADGSVSGVVAGDTCTSPPTLPNGFELTGQDSTGLTDDYHIGILSSGACAKNDNVYHAPDAVYQIVVPSGKTLTVQVTPENIPTLWDPALALVTDCANAVCVAGHDDSDLTGKPEIVSWTNPGASATVFVIVDSFQSSAHDHGRYRILAVVN